MYPCSLVEKPRLHAYLYVIEVDVVSDQISGHTVLLCKHVGRFTLLIHNKYRFLGLVGRKPVFGVSHKVRFKPASTATETSQKIGIALEESLDMIVSNM